MIGAANPLNQTFDILGCAHLDHKINVTPVDAQIKAARAHDRTQLAVHHCVFDLFPGLAGQRAVVNANRQRVFIREPEVVKKDLCLRAGVVKDQRGFVAFDLL